MKISTPARACAGWIAAAMITAAGAAEPALPADKQTVLGLYVTAKQAYEQWQSRPGEIRILDVRTPAEYVFVGHPAMAVNIPLKFLEPGIDPQEHKPVMSTNANFVAEVRAKFDPAETIMVMCRSGNRSAAAANLLAQAGYTRVYSITDGFEGEPLSAPGAPQDGHRVVDGWRNSGAPWSYALDPQLIHAPAGPAARGR